MSFSTSNPVVGQLLPLIRSNGSHVKWSTTIVMVKNSDLRPTPSQLKANEEKLQLKPVTAVSRREMMCLGGVSLAGVSLSLPGPAEARMTKREMKNKILEKLKELREKFGLPKQKDEYAEQTSSPRMDDKVEEKKSTLQPENIEKNSTTQLEVEGRDAFTPNSEHEGGEKSTAQPEVEGRDKSMNQETSGGEASSIPQKNNESPILPFLNLSEIEPVEATLSLDE